MQRSKHWHTMVDILDRQFPKGECKERGRALVMLAYIEMMLNGTEFENGEPKVRQVATDTLNKIGAWVGGDDTGLSSKFLSSIALGSKEGAVHYPYDPSDFGRCYRFLSLLTPEEQTKVLTQAAERSEKWAALVEHWDELVALFEEESKGKSAPKLYKRMKELGV